MQLGVHIFVQLGIAKKPRAKWGLMLILFMMGCTQPQATDKRKIGIVPFGNFKSADVTLVQDALVREYGSTVVILPGQKMPDLFSINIKSPRFRADSIIAYLRRTKSDSLTLILGLTNDDVSVTKKEKDGSIKKPIEIYNDFGVFGYGYVSAPGAVVSSFRIKSKRYQERLVKISVHEIGHNLGLSHCNNPNCVMTDAAEKIATIDEAEMHLCAFCKSKLE
jgi:archaemetzincin